MSVIKKIIVAVVMCCVFASLAAMEVKVVEVSGKVEVQRDNKWVAVAKGDILPAGSVISTGFKSEAVLSFYETVIKVKALTRLTIEQLFEKDGNKASSVYLDTGSISADVKPAENKRVGFSVKTPAATASVRGTSGDVYSDGTVYCTSGRWVLTGPEEKLVFVESTESNKEEGEQEQSDTTQEQGDVAQQHGDTAAVENAAEGESGSTPSAGETEQAVGGTESSTGETGQATLQPEPVQSGEAVITVKSARETLLIDEDFDFSFPNDYGAVYINPGETATVFGGSFITPQDDIANKTSGNSGVKLLSETESVSPSTPQVVVESSKPATTTVVVPEKPKYGTVEINITLPSQLPQN